MKDIGNVSARAAFTLVEVLVAIAVSAAVLTLLLVVSSQALNLWARIGGNAAAAAQGRMVLDQIEEDLASMVVQADGKVWITADVLTSTATSGYWVAAKSAKPAGESLILDAENIEDCRFGVAGVWLRFFVGTNFESRAGVKAIGYQIVRRGITPSSSSELAYELYRSEVSAKNTLTAGYDISPSGNYTTGTLASDLVAVSITKPHRNKVLADHVVDFGVRLFRWETGELRPLFPAAGDSWDNSHLSYRIQEGTAEQSSTARPAVADVMVRILTEEGVRKLRLYENPPTGYTPNDTWWGIVEKNSKVMSRRIVLQIRK